MVRLVDGKHICETLRYTQVLAHCIYVMEVRVGGDGCCEVFIVALARMAFE